MSEPRDQLGTGSSRRPLVALVTSADWPHLAPDDRGIAPALADLGIDAEIAVWTDERVQWSRFDLVLVRSCWDYHNDLPRWLAWVDARAAGDGAASCGLCNAPAVLRWNARKTYLATLEQKGVPVIPTRWVPEASLTSVRTFEAALADCPWEEMICKPAISAGALGTFRLHRSQSMATEFPALQAMLPELRRRSPALVQPFVPEIARRGEWSLLFFSGRFSHAVLKRPRAGDFRVQEKHGGTTVQASPPQALADAAAQVLVAAGLDIGLRAAQLLYARVDLVETAAGPLLVELELTEPALFLETPPAAAPPDDGATVLDFAGASGTAAPVRALAAAIAQRLDR